MRWNFLDPDSRATIDSVWRHEAERMFDLVADPEIWNRPTAAGHWTVRDIVAHLAHNTEGYLRSFDAVGAPPSDGLVDLHDMAKMMDEGARSLSHIDRRNLLDRLRSDLDLMLLVSADLSDADWTDLMVPHEYLGPTPAAFFPICQVLDYAVHGWDVREGGEGPHGLGGEAADLLVPVSFVIWGNTHDTAGTTPFELGIRVNSGPHAGTTRAQVSSDGVEFTSGPVDDMAAVMEFDPASLVLTATGRVNAGTYRGDPTIIKRFLDLFFRV